MKITVLSDIHGNYVALQECIKYAMNREIDTFILLGNYVGELAYPQKVNVFIGHLTKIIDLYILERYNKYVEYKSDMGHHLY